MAQANRGQPQAQQQMEIQIAPPHLAPLSDGAADVLKQHRAAWQQTKDAAAEKGDEFNAPTPPVPAELCEVTLTVQPMDQQLLALSPDGTAVLAYRFGLPGALLKDMGKVSGLLGPDGHPTGAVAALQTALANIAPRIVLTMRRSSLSEDAVQALEQLEERLAADQEPTEETRLGPTDFPLPNIQREQE